MGSILSEFSYLFQSFTEGELKQIVGALVDRKSQRRESAEDSAEDDEVQGGTAGWSTEDRQGRRTKRAHKGKKGCSLQEVRRTVTELGLGYESDETVVFRYCSGRCTTQRRNYDIILEHLQKGRQLDESSVSLERKARARRDKARYSPCCRPTRYENSMSFLDNKNQFYTIPYVSARECGCV
ncbi:neurturin [Engraulis encrasicolus]|uniref:neurturin n=1 Tax=Engraulis encrasicolus TaxID=184585 RepID=UPI002FD6324B